MPGEVSFKPRAPRASDVALKRFKEGFPGGACGCCGCRPAGHDLVVNTVVCKTHGGKCNEVFGAGEFHRHLMRWAERQGAVK